MIITCHRQRLIITWVICLAFFMELLDATALNTSLPQIAHSLMVNPIHLKIALVSYLLSVGLLLPASAYCADRFGTCRLFIFANTVFMLGSIGCGLSNHITTLVIFRVIQGIGGAFLSPVARLIMVTIYPKSDILKGQTMASSIASLGLILGPLVGGALTTFISWHAIFFINVPVAVIAIIMAIKLLPNHKKSNYKAFDTLGYLYLAIGITSLLFFLDMSYSPALSIINKMLLLGSGLIGFIAYIRHSHLHCQPLFNKKIWRMPTLCRLMTTSFLMRLSMNSIPFLVPLLLQSVYHFSAWTSALSLSGAAIGFGAAKPLLRYLSKHIAIKPLLYLSITTNALITSAITFSTHRLELAPLIILIFLFGLTQSLIVSSLNTKIYQSVTPDTTSEITTLNSSIVQISACFAVAIAAMILMLSGHAHAIDSPHLSQKVFHWVFVIEASIALLAMISLKSAHISTVPDA